MRGGQFCCHQTPASSRDRTTILHDKDVAITGCLCYTPCTCEGQSGVSMEQEKRHQPTIFAASIRRRTESDRDLLVFNRAVLNLCSVCVVESPLVCRCRIVIFRCTSLSFRFIAFGVPRRHETMSVAPAQGL